jgi:hypothetical protein
MGIHSKNSFQAICGKFTMSCICISLIRYLLSDESSRYSFTNPNINLLLLQRILLSMHLLKELWMLTKKRLSNPI